MPWLNPYRTPNGEPVDATARVTHLPVYVLWTLWGFAVSWVESRRFSRVVAGLPAVALAVMLVLLMLSSSKPASPDTISTYLTRAQQATQAENFEQAEFLFRKLEQLAPRDAEIRFEHAMLHARQESYPIAASMLHSLIDDNDQTDDAKVHLELAKWAMEGKLKVEDPLAYAKINLNQVMLDEPRNLEAHYFYSQLFLRSKPPDIVNAIQHLEQVASRAPELQMQLAYLYAMNRDPTRARSAARSVVQVLEAEVRDQPAAEVTTWQRLAKAHLLLEQYEQAVTVLRQAITKFDDEASRRLLGRVYVHWSDAAIAANPQDTARQLELLQEALQVAPDEPSALQRVIDLTDSEGPEGETANRWLKEVLGGGKAQAVVHFILGTRAAGKGDMATAEFHLSQADELNPKTAVTLNNLAFVLTKMDPPDLPRALEMSNQAVRIAPDAAPFLETRGQILTLMEEYQQAITDLEKALPGMTNLNTRINIHRSLATCYEHRGDVEMSQIHIERAEKLESQTGTQRPAERSIDPTDALDLDLDSESPEGVIPPASGN